MQTHQFLQQSDACFVLLKNESLPNQVTSGWYSMPNKNIVIDFLVHYSIYFHQVTSSCCRNGTPHHDTSPTVLHSWQKAFIRVPFALPPSYIHSAYLSKVSSYLSKVYFRVIGKHFMSLAIVWQLNPASERAFIHALCSIVSSFFALAMFKYRSGSLCYGLQQF